MHEQQHELQPELPLEYGTSTPLAEEQLSTKTNALRASAPLYGAPQWELKETITSQEELVALAKKLKGLSCFPIDTETYGLGDEAINKRLSLIQIGIPERPGDRDSQTKGETYLIDVLALEEESEFLAEECMMPPPNPLAPLKAVLEDTRITKIAQNAGFEKDQLDKYGIALDGIADTMTLGREILPYIKSKALNALTVEFLGTTLDKDQQKSAWGRRPLTQRQELYAYLDPEVTYRVWIEQRDRKYEGRVDKRLGSERLMEAYQDQQEELASLRRPIAEDLARCNTRIAGLEGSIKALLYKDISERVSILTEEIKENLAPVLEGGSPAKTSALQEVLFTEFSIDLIDPKKAERGTIQFLKGDPETRLLDLLEERMEKVSWSEYPESVSEVLQERIDRLRDCFKRQRELSPEELAEETFEITFSLPQYRTVFGSVGMAQYDDTFSDIEQLKQLLPDIADRIVYETLTKTDLDRGLREAGMKKKDRDIILESVTVEGEQKEKYYFAPNYEAMYERTAKSLPKYTSKVKQQTITTQKKLASFVDLCLKSDVCTVDFTTTDEGLPKQITIGLPQKSGTLSVMQQVAIINVEKLAGTEALTADLCDGALQALAPLFSSDKVTKLIYDERASKRTLKFAGLPGEGLLDLDTHISGAREDMIATSPGACAVELFGKNLRASDVKGRHDVMLKSYQVVQDLLEATTSYCTETQAEETGYEAKVERMLESMLQHEAEKAALLRGLGTDYQIAHLKAQYIEGRLQEQVERKYQRNRGTSIHIETEAGMTGVQVEDTNVIDIDKVRELYPFIEALEIEDRSTGEMRSVIRESFLWGDLDVELKQLAEGLLKPHMRETIKDELRIEAGYQAPRYYLYPKYSHLY